MTNDKKKNITIGEKDIAAQNMKMQDTVKIDSTVGKLTQKAKKLDR